MFVTATVLADVSGVVSAVLAVVAVGVTIYLWWRSRQRKAIAYRLVASRVVSVRPEAQGRISILYDGEKVEDVHLVDLLIRNSGNVPVAATDFERPFAIVLGDRAHVLGFEVARTSPTDLSPVVTADSGCLTVAPLLLNPGDSFELSALVSDSSARPRLEARVSGVAKLADLGGYDGSRSQLISKRDWIVSTLAGALVAIVGLVAGAAIVEWQDHTDTRVELVTGESLCGKVLRVGERTIIVRLQDSGALRTLPVSRVRAVKDKSC